MQPDSSPATSSVSGRAPEALPKLRVRDCSHRCCQRPWRPGATPNPTRDAGRKAGWSTSVRNVRPDQPGPGMPEVPMSASLLGMLKVLSSKATIPVGVAAITPMAVAAITHAAMRVRKCRVFMASIRCWTRCRITAGRWSPRFGGTDGRPTTVETRGRSLVTRCSCGGPESRGERYRGGTFEFSVLGPRL